MGKVDDVLWWASSQIGYCGDDDPEPGSKYGRWMARLTGEDWLAGPSRDIWWCCIFVSWCLYKSGVNCNGFPSYNTDLALAYAGDALIDNIYEARPGDVIFFNWDDNLSTDHVGIVEANHGDWIQTIEGNVSNSVQRVARDWEYVTHIMRPNYSEQFEGDDDIRYMQLQVNAALARRQMPAEWYIQTDGLYGPETSGMLVRLMQEWAMVTYDPSIECTGEWSDAFAAVLNKQCVQATHAILPVWITKAALIGHGYKGAYLDLDDPSYKAMLKDTIADFQRDHDIPPTGCIDDRTFRSLIQFD